MNRKADTDDIPIRIIRAYPGLQDIFHGDEFTGLLVNLKFVTQDIGDGTCITRATELNNQDTHKTFY